MGFLNQFFQDVFHQNSVTPKKNSSFEKISEEELKVHLNIAKYDDFELTDAIRPSYDVRIKPQQAYRHDCFLDEENQSNVPVIMASATHYYQDPQVTGCFRDRVGEPPHKMQFVKGHTSYRRLSNPGSRH